MLRAAIVVFLAVFRSEKLLQISRLCGGLAFTASVILLVSEGARPVLAQVQDPSSCYEIIFPEDPEGALVRWPTSGAWTADRNTFLLVDAYEEEILGVSMSDGKISGWLEVASAIGATDLQSQLEEPRQIRPLEDGWILLSHREAFELDSHFDPRRRLAVRDRMIEDDAALGTIGILVVYDFIPVGEGILAFADIARSDGSSKRYESGFIYFDESGQHQIYRSVAIDAPARSLYVRNIRYLASIDRFGYYMSIEDSPHIVEVRTDGSMRKLSLFPERFKGLPDLRDLPRNGWRKATEIYQRQESTAMPVGLFAWKHYLYLLAKDAMNINTGETAWWIIKMDPQDGAELSRARLPTGAAHLTVVPGEEFWAVIERTSVRGVGKLHVPHMEVPSMLLIPATWLGGYSPSPLSEGQTEQVICSRIGQ